MLISVCGLQDLEIGTLAHIFRPVGPPHRKKPANELVRKKKPKVGPENDLEEENELTADLPLMAGNDSVIEPCIFCGGEVIYDDSGDMYVCVKCGEENSG